MPLPNFDIEKSFWKKGYKHVAGVDEVGRGSWAGPVVAAAVILPQNFIIPNGFNDSKKVRLTKRIEFSKFIKKIAISYYISEINVSTINKYGIGQSTQKAFRKAVKSLKQAADFVLIDAFIIKQFAIKNQLAVKKGDEKSASIAAASIIAKVHRDNLMNKISNKIPQFSFEKHKGYGTIKHQQEISRFGFTKYHRSSFNLKFLLT